MFVARDFLCHDESMEFFRFLYRSFVRESGVIGAIIRSVAFAASPGLAVLAGQIFGFDTTAAHPYVLPALAFSIPATLLYRAYKYGHALEDKAVTKLAMTSVAPMAVLWGDAAGKSVKLKVEAVGLTRIRNCRIEITRFEFFDGQKFEQVGPELGSRPPWANVGTNIERLDIDPAIPTYAGLMKTVGNQEVGQEFMNVDALTMPHLNPPIFRQHGAYRLTVTVSGDDTAPCTKKVLIEWNGKWNEIQSKFEV